LSLPNDNKLYGQVFNAELRRQVSAFI